ncbi:MAG: hypothetical protein M3340_18480, partial [Actinomycetota bacterium]|nr:hypothetical protein [Actinomycetota bacterium]
MLNRLTTSWWALPLASAVLAACALVAYGPGAIGYDASYALLWGDDLWHGRSPGYEAPGAPTPHPLLNAICAPLAPLGDASGDALLVLTALSFGWLVVAGYLLGARLFSRPVGVVFGALLITRATLGGEMAQALVDVPYLALVVSAAAVEARRPRAGVPVLVQLGLAGLLRPEGWLLAGAYALYLLPPLDLRRRARALALAAAAPLLWAASDLAVTGDPLFSLHTTRDLAETLNRPRDFRAAVETAPQYLESVLGTGVALVGLAGCVVAAVVLYERALLPLAILGLGLLAFMALGVAGLPILTRYLLVPGVVLALLCAVVLAGWTAVPRGSPWRRRLAVLAVAGAAGVALRPALIGAQSRARVALALGFVALATAAFLHGSLLSAADETALVLIRGIGIVLLALGTVGLTEDRTTRRVLWAALVALAVAEGATALGADGTAAWARAVGAFGLGAVLVVSARRSIPA